jgi:hypothetical protein
VNGIQQPTLHAAAFFLITAASAVYHYGSPSFSRSDDDGERAKHAAASNVSPSLLTASLPFLAALAILVVLASARPLV